MLLAIELGALWVYAQDLRAKIGASRDPEVRERALDDLLGALQNLRRLQGRWDRFNA